jgi:16S rRNA (guanine527-N7)-methyltransferase
MSETQLKASTFLPDLSQGAAKIGADLTEQQSLLLLQFLALLYKWNKAFNLTAVRDPKEMLGRHLLDSLSMLPVLMKKRSKTQSNAFTVLDVGTGPGLPGIPLAICMPDTNFVLLDSNGKKTRFVFQACVELGLKNVEVQTTRIENYQRVHQVDIVVSRAFASLKDFVEGCHAVVGPNTRLIAMKGLYPTEEIAALPSIWTVVDSQEVHIPGSEGVRHFIELAIKKAEKNVRNAEEK